MQKSTDQTATQHSQEAVVILSIEHRHGHDSWACDTEQTAYGVLDHYVQTWWDDEMPADAAMPPSAEERREAYFEQVCMESWCISASPIITRPEDAIALPEVTHGPQR